ncbi:MAG: tRNA 2-thiouridine(34) synthase MnmA [Elusimicrobium sp.]|jgi:tRNA-specific 2-thiouridylase|nr:tRNA 2-thiouridine(34) synthase MnmA [Elusimicrobium sp.]
MKILVGLSGGVDSALTAALLKEQGHEEVAGAIMSTWDPSFPAPKAHGNACFGPEEQDIETAAGVARALNIPFYVIDCRGQFKKIVLENFKDEYKKGRTPNPCVICNSFIKFGALPAAAAAQGIEFDKFATGHYARIEEKDGKFLLKTAIDMTRDQTYFLYRLTQGQLSKTIFPLGAYTKKEVRALAKAKNIPVADKEDSQDFYCGDYNDILKFDAAPGSIVDKTGKILGTHGGVWNFTVGKRKGVGISGSKEPLYVTQLLAKQNLVVVGPKKDLYKDFFTASDLSWPAGAPANSFRAKVKIRQMHPPAPAAVTLKNDKAEIKFDEPQMSITSGQSAVFYDGDTVLGGGIID